MRISCSVRGTVTARSLPVVAFNAPQIAGNDEQQHPAGARPCDLATGAQHEHGDGGEDDDRGPPRPNHHVGRIGLNGVGPSARFVRPPADASTAITTAMAAQIPAYRTDALPARTRSAPKALSTAQASATTYRIVDGARKNLEPGTMAYTN